MRSGASGRATGRGGGLRAPISSGAIGTCTLTTEANSGKFVRVESKIAIGIPPRGWGRPKPLTIKARRLASSLHPLQNGPSDHGGALWSPNSCQVAMPSPSKSTFSTGYWRDVPKCQGSSRPVAALTSPSSSSTSTFQLRYMPVYLEGDCNSEVVFPSTPSEPPCPTPTSKPEVRMSQ